MKFCVWYNFPMLPVERENPEENLAVFIGVSSMSFFRCASEQKCSFQSYPFAYSENLFSHYLDEKAFYERILSEVMGVADVFQMPNLYITSFARPLWLDDSHKGYTDLKAVLETTDHFNPVLIDGLMAYAGGEFLYDCDFAPYAKSEELVDFMSNLNVYPFVCSTDDQERTATDELPQRLVSSPKPQLPVVFTGGRFLRDGAYLLALNMVKQTGVFDLYMDTENRFVPFELLRLHRPQLYDALAAEVGYQRIGALLNIPGETECLIKDSLGATRFVKAQDNDLTIIPLVGEDGAEITVRNGKGYKLEARVRGGVLGAVVDTRDKSRARFGAESELRDTNRWEAVIDAAMKGL